MDDKKHFISEYGLTTSIVTCIMGVSIFSQSRLLVKETGTLAWLVVLLAAFLAFLCAMIIYKTIENNDYAPIDAILENSFGKILGKLVGISFSIYGLYSLSSGLRNFVEVVKITLLPNAHTELIIIIMILTGIYLVRGGIRCIVSFNEVCFWIMFIPIICMFFSLKQADITNIFPLIPDENFSLLKGINASIFAFAGFEILFFLTPYIENRKRAKKNIRTSFIIIGITYSITIFLTIALFSKTQTERLLWPTLTLVRSINIPGTFLERWEGIVMIFWIIFYYTTFINIYYFSSDILRGVFRLKEVRLTVPFTSILTYIFAMYPQNILEVNRSEEIIIPIGSYIFLIGLPLILLFISKIKQKKVQSNEKKV